MVGTDFGMVHHETGKTRRRTGFRKAGTNGGTGPLKATSSASIRLVVELIETRIIKDLSGVCLSKNDTKYPFLLEFFGPMRDVPRW
jgi:hypothetical protein